MTTAEYEYALDMRMTIARRETVQPLTGREVALAVRQDIGAPPKALGRR